jgi:hypothetical protein
LLRPLEHGQGKEKTMRYMKWLGPTLTVVALLGAPYALAQEKVTAQNDVSFVSGGVGADSEERLTAHEKDFNLKLVFTLVEGNYVSDVNVVLKSAAGKTLIDSVADGPFFMAKLPAGNYTLALAYNGQEQQRKVSVAAGKLRTEYIRWKRDPNTDFVLPPESYRE